MYGLPPTTEWRTITFLDDIHFDIAFDGTANDPISKVYAEGRFPHSAYSTLLPHWLRPGTTVLDLGAHLGSFALVAAALGCRVLAVEAGQWNATYLRASAARNGFTELQVIHAAVSDRPGTLDFFPYGPFGFVAPPGSNEPGWPVRAVTVDDLLAEVGWPRVDIVKLDVEGSEVAAVRGMSRLLSSADAPPLIYESNGHTLHLFGQSPTALKAALESCGYRNYLIEPGQLVPEQVDDMQACVVTDNLAVKDLPPLPSGWQMAARRSRSEIVAQIMTAAASPEEHQRLYVAQCLKTAPTWLRSQPAVQQALAELREDRSAEVRAAAGSIGWAARASWRERWADWWRQCG